MDRQPQAANARVLPRYARVARETFGDVPLREIGPAQLRAFDKLSEGQSDASRLRHLRQLSVCLQAAVDEDRGLLDLNPVRSFTKKSRLKAPRRGKAPFEDGELERMWEAMADYEPVYPFLCRFSVETGARLGEIVALDWRNVDLTAGRIYLEHSWDDEDGAITPKDNEARWIYLTPEARAVVEGWVAVTGVHDDGPVFPSPFGGGRERLNKRVAQRRLEAAMTAADVPKLHPELRLPRSFHSFRYTTSNLMQRRGVHPRLIEQTLGHGSLELTYGVYGGWTPQQLKAEANRED